MYIIKWSWNLFISLNLLLDDEYHTSSVSKIYGVLVQCMIVYTCDKNPPILKEPRSCFCDLSPDLWTSKTLDIQFHFDRLKSLTCTPAKVWICIRFSNVFTTHKSCVLNVITPSFAFSWFNAFSVFLETPQKYGYLSFEIRQVIIFCNIFFPAATSSKFLFLWLPFTHS